MACDKRPYMDYKSPLWRDSDPGSDTHQVHIVEMEAVFLNELPVGLRLLDWPVTGVAVPFLPRFRAFLP